MEDDYQDIRLNLEQEIYELVESHRYIASILNLIEDISDSNVAYVIKTLRAHCSSVVNDSDARAFRAAAKNAADKVSKWESWKKEGLQFAEINKE